MLLLACSHELTVRALVWKDQYISQANTEKGSSRENSKDEQLTRQYFHNNPLLLVDVLPPTPEPDLNTLTVAKMKIELREHGVSADEILEKRDLKERLKRVRTEKRMRFVYLHDARWSAADLGERDLFGSRLHFLDRTAEYANLHRFFQRTLQVQEAPTAEDLAQLLNDLVRQRRAGEEGTAQLFVKRMLAVYAELSRVVQYLSNNYADNNSRASLKQLATQAVFVSKSLGFHEAQTILIPDDDELTRSFEDQQGVNLLYGTRQDQSRCESWLRFAGCKPLSKCCETRVLHVEERPHNVEFTKYLQSLIHAFARFDFIHDRPHFDAIGSRDGGGWASFKSVRCFELPKVEVEYTLSVGATSAKKRITRTLLIQGHDVYLTRSAMNDTLRTPVELARAFFGEGKDEVHHSRASRLPLHLVPPLGALWIAPPHPRPHPRPHHLSHSLASARW